MAGERGRQVVVGVSDGRSRIERDGPAPRRMTLDQMGGFTKVALWDVSTPLPAPRAGGDPSADPLPIQPPAGHVSVEIDVIPPAAALADIDADAFAAEAAAKYPGLLEVADPDGSGFHTTDTLDFVTVVSGRLVLAVDDGETELGPGDTVIMQGAHHAWRNPGDEPCVITCVMLRPAR